MISRRKARENAFYALFAVSFGTEVEDVLAAFKEEAGDDEDFTTDAFGEELLALYKTNAEAVDAKIESKLKGWNVKRLQKVNLAILRLSVAELLYGGPDMDSIVINEAVELAKRFGDEADYQFVNGVLGSVSREKTGEGEPENTGDSPAPAGEV